MSASSRVRVAVVGLSARAGWAARSHLPALRGLEGFSLEGVLASTPRASRAAAAAHRIPEAFDSIHELAASDRIDLVVVAVRVPDHAALVAPILTAGIPVYCEWPLGSSLTETEELAQAAARTGTVGFVGLQGRQTPAMRWVDSLLRRGAIGTVLSSAMHVRAASWGPRTDLRSAYLRDASSGAGLLSIAGGHALDMLASCLGEFADVSARCAVRCTRVEVREGGWITADSPDHLMISGTLRGGQAVSIELEGGRGAGPDFRWEIVGERGRLRITCDEGLPQHGRLRIREELDRGGARHLEIPPEYDLAPHLADGDGHAVAHAYLAVHSDLTQGTALAPRFRDAAVRHGLLDAIERSSALGTPVRLAV